MNVFIGYSRGTRLSAYSFLKIKGMSTLCVAVPRPSGVIGWLFLCCVPSTAHLQNHPPHLDAAVLTQDYELEAPRGVQEPALPFLPCTRHTLHVSLVLGALQKLSLYSLKTAPQWRLPPSPTYCIPHLADGEIEAQGSRVCPSSEPSLESRCWGAQEGSSHVARQAQVPQSSWNCSRGRAACPRHTG